MWHQLAVEGRKIPQQFARELKPRNENHANTWAEPKYSRRKRTPVPRAAAYTETTAEVQSGSKLRKRMAET